MSIEASLPMLLAIFGVSCSVFGVNTLVMGRLCRSKGIELSRKVMPEPKPNVQYVLCVQIIQLYTYTATYDSENHNHLVSVIGRLQLCAVELNRIMEAGDSASVLGSVDEAVDCIFRVQHSLSELAIGKEPELAQDPIGNKPLIYGETGAGKSVFKRDEIVKRLRTEASSKADIPPVEMWIQPEDITSAIDYVEFVGKRNHAEPR